MRVGFASSPAFFYYINHDEIQFISGVGFFLRIAMAAHLGRAAAQQGLELQALLPSFIVVYSK